jgi:hypothetical protein
MTRGKEERTGDARDGKRGKETEDCKRDGAVAGRREASVSEFEVLNCFLKLSSSSSGLYCPPDGRVVSPVATLCPPLHPLHST